MSAENLRKLFPPTKNQNKSCVDSEFKLESSGKENLKVNVD